MIWLLSPVQLFAIPWTIVHHVSPSMGFSKQEYWNALPFPSPGDLPNPGIEPVSPALQADPLPSQSSGKPKSELLVAQPCPTLLCPPGFSVHEILLAKILE